MRLPDDLGAAAAGQKVEVATEVGLQDVLDIEPVIAAAVFCLSFGGPRLCAANGEIPNA
jgi:hypothetical protein